MTYLHNSKPVILHRDLKSHNLLVDEHYKVKISDFGLSKVMDPQTRTMTSCGTAAWAAPEILKNSRYTEKADVYSYGICLWEFFTRCDPYEGMPVFQIIFSVGTEGMRPTIPDNCPPDYSALMRECWDIEATNRPSFSIVLQRLSDMDIGGPEQTRTALALSKHSKNEDVQHLSDKDKDENKKENKVVEILVAGNNSIAANEQIKYPQLEVTPPILDPSLLQKEHQQQMQKQIYIVEDFQQLGIANNQNNVAFQSTTVS